MINKLQLSTLTINAPYYLGCHVLMQSNDDENDGKVEGQPLPDYFQEEDQLPESRSSHGTVNGVKRAHGYG